jgi:hypothetical protein
MTPDETETMGRALIADLALMRVGQDDAEAIAEFYHHIREAARAVFDRLCPELNTYERGAAANRFLQSVQDRAFAIESRCAGAVSQTVH